MSGKEKKNYTNAICKFNLFHDLVRLATLLEAKPENPLGILANSEEKAYSEHHFPQKMNCLKQCHFLCKKDHRSS